MDKTFCLVVNKILAFCCPQNFRGRGCGRGNFGLQHCYAPYSQCQFQIPRSPGFPSQIPNRFPPTEGPFTHPVPFPPQQVMPLENQIETEELSQIPTYFHRFPRVFVFLTFSDAEEQQLVCSMSHTFHSVDAQVHVFHTVLDAYMLVTVSDAMTHFICRSFLHKKYSRFKQSSTIDQFLPTVIGNFTKSARNVPCLHTHPPSSPQVCHPTKLFLSVSSFAACGGEPSVPKRPG